MESYLHHHSVQTSGLGTVMTIAQLSGKTEILRRRTLDCFALVWVTQGEGWFRQQDGPRQSIQARDAFLLFPGVPHGYGPVRGSSWTEWFILFEGPVFELWKEQGVLSLARSPLRLSPPDIWESRIRRLPDAGSALEQVCALQTLLARTGLTESTFPSGLTESDWLQRACSLLDHHRLDGEAEKIVALQMGLSYQTFRKRFRRAMGMPPGAYRRGRVLELAGRRLLTESTPIKEIAADLGFCDEYHFSKRFRAVHGISPAAYRKRVR